MSSPPEQPPAPPDGTAPSPPRGGAEGEPEGPPPVEDLEEFDGLPLDEPEASFSDDSGDEGGGGDDKVRARWQREACVACIFVE